MLVVVAAIAVAFIGAIAGAAWLQARAHNVAEAAAWKIVGAPCATASAQAFSAWPVKPHEGFGYDGVTFAHGYGHASCNEIHNDEGRGFGTHPVCQFTAPAVLHVTTQKGDFYFIAQTGPATVTVQDKVATCVRAAWFGKRSQW